MQVSDNTLYLRQETRMAVDERQDAKKIFDKDYFEWAAERLNAGTYDVIPAEVTNTIPYTDYFIFKVTVSKEQSDSPKIRISDIHGLFYATSKGEIKYVENPEKGK
jgi:hypothetical protein